MVCVPSDTEPVFLCCVCFCLLSRVLSNLVLSRVPSNCMTTLPDTSASQFSSWSHSFLISTKSYSCHRHVVHSSFGTVFPTAGPMWYPERDYMYKQTRSFQKFNLYQIDRVGIQGDELSAEDDRYEQALRGCDEGRAFRVKGT